jgi:SAM-dependent methyltransferase
MEVRKNQERRFSMKTSNRISLTMIILLLSIIFYGAFGQENTQSSDFVPHVGQPGKDVIWVPTPDALVSKMLEIAEVNASDFLIDLGSGDGRTVIAAARLGATAVGIEYNPDMVALSKKKAEEAGISAKTTFLQADLFKSDLSKATVITMFLLPEINLKLRPLLLNLKPGTRIISNTFTMGDWEPDYEVTTDDNSTSWNTALMWIIPAKIGGIWKLGGEELDIRQEFQMFFGTLKHDSTISSINEGRISGDTVAFIIDRSSYSGRMTGEKTMSGTVTSNSGKSEWTATYIGTGE